jgi:hypothetical protein
MLRFLVRYGVVRVVGRRAVPMLMLWDAAVLANRARRIPVVDRTLRRGAAAAADRFAATLEGLAPTLARTSPTSAPTTVTRPTAATERTLPDEAPADDRAS